MDLMVRRWRLWGDSPGGNREAVSLNRVADTLSMERCSSADKS